MPPRIRFFDQPWLPRTIPFFHSLLSGDRESDIVVLLEIHEAMNAETLGEACNEVTLMFEGTPDDIVGDTDIQGAVLRTRKDVDEVGAQMSVFVAGESIWRVTKTRRDLGVVAF